MIFSFSSVSFWRCGIFQFWAAFLKCGVRVFDFHSSLYMGGGSRSVVPFTQEGIDIFSDAVHKMKFRKRTISSGKKISEIKLVSIRHWISAVKCGYSLTREIMRSILAQVMKNPRLSTVTHLIKFVLFSKCVSSSLFVLLHWTLISLWILVLQLSNFFIWKVSLWTMFP